MNTESLICVVCTEEVTQAMEAWCNACGSVFHLSQVQDDLARDCGEVWINANLALSFGCNRCLEEARAEAPSANLDDILDLDEAAAAAGMEQAALLQVAQDGGVPHRKTSGGAYLFARRDVLALISGEHR